jgi:hypothetical protein
MKYFFIFLGIALLPLVAMAQKPPAGLAPMGALGDFSEMEKTILFNSLQEYLSTYYALASQKAFEQAQDAAFDELDYEECTEDQCFAAIQQILQVDNLFLFNVTREGTFTQLSLTAVNLDSERLVRTAVCDNCGIGELNAKVEGMVLKIVEATQETPVSSSEPAATAGTESTSVATAPTTVESKPITESDSELDEPEPVAGTRTESVAGTPERTVESTPEPESVAGTPERTVESTPEPEPVVEPLAKPAPEPVTQSIPEAGSEPEIQTNQSKSSNWVWHAVTLGVTGVAMLQAKSAADEYNTLSSLNKELATSYASNPDPSYSSAYESNQSKMKSLKSSAETYDLITYVGLGVEAYLLFFASSEKNTAFQQGSGPFQVIAASNSLKLRFQWNF